MGYRFRSLHVTAFCSIALLSACGPKNELPPVSSLNDPHLAQIVRKQSAANDVPPALVLAIIEVESGGNPSAVGSSGSVGLMQVKPATAKHYGITNLMDPVSNVTAGVHYLRDLIVRYHGNLHFAVAAYQAGPRTVDEAHGIPPGTQHYVDKVFAAYARYRQALSWLGRDPAHREDADRRG